MNRNLDGCYFRVKRDGKWQSVCFSDLTLEERDQMVEGKSPVWLRALAYHLADSLQSIGEQFGKERME